MRRVGLIAALFVACADAGAPGTASAGPDTATTVRISSGPDRIGPGSEEYREYETTMPTGGFVVRFDPSVPADDVLLHHLILMRGEPIEAPDGRPMFPTVFASGRGTGSLEMPDGVGLRIDEGEPLRLGLHLVNATDAEIAFVLGVEMQVVGEVEEEADVVTIGPAQLEIPPDSEEHAVGSACPAGGDRTFFAAYPHMHGLGTSIEISVGGEGVAAVDPWDFGDQPLLQFDAGGDDVGVECTYVNPGPDPVRFGHSSGDEMCLAFVFYYPAGLTRQWGCPGTIDPA